MPYEKVIAVIDGAVFKTATDTIKLEKVSALEKGTPALGITEEKLVSLILSKNVRYEVKDSDAFGRAVSQVWVNGLNVGIWFRFSSLRTRAHEW